MVQALKVPFVIFVAAVLAIFAVSAYRVYAEVAFSINAEPGSYLTFSFFNATTTNATSTNGAGGYFKIAGAKNVELYFSRGGATGPNTGSSRFSIQVSPDGSSWYDYNDLLVNA